MEVYFLKGLCEACSTLEGLELRHIPHPQQSAREWSLRTKIHIGKGFRVPDPHSQQWGGQS